MSRAIGGYVRRSERRCAQPGPAAEMRGPNWLRYSVMPSGMVMCWRLEPPAFQVMPVLGPMLPLHAEDET